MSQKTQTSVAAELTRWAIERNDFLMREKLPMKNILKAFERDTGLHTTYYTVKQVFATLDVPVGRAKRKTDNSRLDRLINEVFILSEKVHLLSVTIRKQVVPSTTDYEMTPELTALHNRHAPPETAEE
tara:strand:+ start:2164 stop:2547 length:384 start_codon:yes stop_codon:yes gene_type:complete